MAHSIVLPGDEIPPSVLPTAQNPSKALTLGPGLRHIPLSVISATVAGSLQTDSKKNAIWVEHKGGRYTPSTSDLVIGIIHHSSPEFYHVSLSAHTPLALLPHLAFESVTRKTRPMLATGALVYARVSAADPFMDTELSCVHPGTEKAQGLGELKGGMVFDVSADMSRRLMMAGKANQRGAVVVLEELAERLRYEIAVGTNGRVWVDSAEGVKSVLAVGRALQATDELGLRIEEQRMFVKTILKDI